MTEPRPGTGRCHLCEDDVPTLGLIDHVRVMHPDKYEPPLTWPDGGYVIEDDCPSIDDLFTGEVDRG